MVDGTVEISRPFGAGIPGYTKTVYRGMGNCVCCGKNIWNCVCPSPKFRQPVSGSQQDVDPGPIIIAGTDGDDYSVLDRVDPRIKKLAVEGQLELPGRVDESNVYHDTRVFSATEETLNEALGPTPNTLSPENKYWIMRQLGFQGKEKGKFKHILMEDSIEFDINSETLIQVAFRIFKMGYQNAHNEMAAQQKIAKYL